MNELPADVGQWAFDFMMVLARVGASMAVLPGMGEATPPAMSTDRCCPEHHFAAAPNYRPRCRKSRKPARRRWLWLPPRW